MGLLNKKFTFDGGPTESHPNLELVLEERDRIWKTALLAYRPRRKPMLSSELEQKSILQNENYEGDIPLILQYNLH